MDTVIERALMHLRRDLTLNAMDDFVPLSAVSWEVNERLDPKSEAEARAAALTVLRDLLSANMLEAGDLVNGKVVPWNGSLEDVMHRIEVALAEPSASEAGWLVATKTARAWGQRYGEMLKDLKP